MRKILLPLLISAVFSMGSCLKSDQDINKIQIEPPPMSGNTYILDSVASTVNGQLVWKKSEFTDTLMHKIKRTIDSATILYQFYPNNKSLSVDSGLVELRITSKGYEDSLRYISHIRKDTVLLKVSILSFLGITDSSIVYYTPQPSVNAYKFKLKNRSYVPAPL